MQLTAMISNIKNFYNKNTQEYRAYFELHYNLSRIMLAQT